MRKKSTSAWVSAQADVLNPMSTTPLRHVTVACGIIIRDGLILAAQRSATMSIPLKWEFPGGKLELNESADDCLHRELREELEIAVRIIHALPCHHFTYPTFSVTLMPFICDQLQGEPILNEHAQIAWVTPSLLDKLDWAPADQPVLADLRAYLSK